MTNRALLKSILAPATVFTLLCFLSCGHQTVAKDDGLFAGMDKDGSSDSASAEASTNEEAASSPSAENTDLSDVAKTEDASTPPTTPKEDTTAGAPTEPPATEASKDAAALESSVEPVASAEPKPADNTLTDPAKPEAAPAPEAEAKTAAAPEAAPKEAPAPLMTEATETAATEAKPAETETATAAAERQPATEAKAPKAMKHGPVSKLPTIPSETISKMGVTLNRFYFLRKGDTPALTSKMIYGTESRSQDLLAWNGEDWKPGKIVYYTSPDQAQDTQMKSFYDERGVHADTYTVKAGDWLSKIAAAQYGHVGSWKEIAVLNNLKRPDRIEPGTQLQMYPVEFPAAHAADVAKAPEPAPAAPVAAAAPTSTPALPAVDTKPAAPAATPVPAAVAQNEATAPLVPSEAIQMPNELKPAAAPKAMGPKAGEKKAQLANPQVGSFIEQHFIFVLAGIAMALGVYFGFRHLRRSRDTIDF